MKKITLLITCFCTAALITLLVVLTKHFPNLFSSIMAFPFEQIGCGLGILSKTGSVGNGIAVAVWIGVSAIPAIIALRYRKGKETLPERAALYVLSAVILLALYGMVNPQLLQPRLSSMTDPQLLRSGLSDITDPQFYRSGLSESFPEYSRVIRAMLGACIWAVAVLYMILRLIRLLRLGNKEQLLTYLRKILYVLCILFTGAAAFSFTNGAIALTGTAQAAADTGFGAFRLMAELVPYVFDLIIILRAVDLLGIAGDEEQDGIVESTGRVSRICCFALGITTALTAASNLLQIALMRWLSNVSVTVEIPVISIAFTVMILLFSRLLMENKRLRDDNSLFI